MNDNDGLIRVHYSDDLRLAAEEYLIQLFRTSGIVDTNLDSQYHGITTAMYIVAGVAPVDHEVSIDRRITLSTPDEDDE